MSESPHHPWAYWLLVALAVEKVVQHAAVTWAFIADRFGVRDAVVVDYRWLAATGALVGVLFVVAVAGLLRAQNWVRPLLIGLALVDIVGEFVAQETISITVTVSFLVAVAILILARRLAVAPVTTAAHR